MSLFPHLQNFAVSLTQNFSSLTKAQPEDQLKPAVKTLLESAGLLFDQNVLLRSEAQVTGLGGRPDFGVDANGLLCGHIELKAPGLGARPNSFSGRDKEQWQKFKALPNLIYTDGNEWSLWRDGASVGNVVRLVGDVKADGANAANEENAQVLENLLRDFLMWQPVVPSQPRELAQMLAPLCRLVREDVAASVANQQSALFSLAREWRDLLFPDADDRAFADAYAQTLTYALLLARVEGGEKLTVDSAADTIQARHGLLSDALRVLAQHKAREEIGVGLDLLLRVVNALQLESWHQRANEGADPWLYFYEDFLAAYDAKLRNERGVYYTPSQVIGAQVRLVDDVLKTQFGFKRGLAEKEVTVLDPAAGTGAYPLAVLKRGLENVTSRLGAGAASGVASQMARSLYAFEFLVGPYAVAHLRIAQAVLDAGGSLPEAGAQVYLADTLESPHALPPQSSLFAKRLATEHERARLVKLAKPVLVCIGNPPYDREQRDDNSDSSTRRGGWIRHGDEGSDRAAPLEDFLRPVRETGQGRYLANLYNDYVYFWRWALWKTFENQTPPSPPSEKGGAGQTVSANNKQSQNASSSAPVAPNSSLLGGEAGRGSRSGIVCFITAASYLRGPGFAGMRQVMRETFDELYILDLEGDNLGARPTQNVFNIQTPVAIALGVRHGKGEKKTARVRYAKIEGTRDEKFATLEAIENLDSIAWRDCPDDLQAPFLPRGDGDFWSWPLLTDVFPLQFPGVKFHRTWPIAESPEVLHERWQTFIEAETAERARLFRETSSRVITNSYLDIETSTRLTPLAALPKDAPAPHLQRYAFRSFDRQWIFSDTRFCDRSRPPLWKSYSDKQVFLTGLLSKVLGDGPTLVASAHIPDMDVFCNRGGKDVIPLWRDSSATQANITDGIVEKLSSIYGRDVRAEDVFAYAYATLSTRSYVRMHWDELTIPGARLPLTRDEDLFAQAATLGHELLRLHTFEERNLEGAPRGEVQLGSAQNTFPTAADIASREGAAQYPARWSYDESAQKLTVGEGDWRFEYSFVAPEIMNYAVSGLNVVKSWLDYRKAGGHGRTSSALDAIRPREWNLDFTSELLELLWTLEHTLKLEAQNASLLQQIVAGELVRAEELPLPTTEECNAPIEIVVSESGQQTMEL